MGNEKQNQEALFDEIIAKIDSIQKDQLIKDSQKMINDKEEPPIVDESLFDEIKNSHFEKAVPQSKSPIRRMLEDDEEENTAEEEQSIAAAAVYEDAPEDIEDFEFDDEKEEIYRDLKNTVGKMAMKSILTFALVLVSLYLFLSGFKPAIFGNAIDTPWFQIVHLALDGFCFALFLSVFLQGLSLLLRARADTDTLLALLCISLIAIRITNIINPQFFSYQLNLEPMLTIGLLFNINAKKKIASNIKRNFKYIAADGDKLTLIKPASCEANNALILETGEGGEIVYAHRTGLVSGFIRNSYSDYEWDYGIQHFLFATLIFVVLAFIALVQLAGWSEAILFPGAALATSLPFFASHYYASSIFKVGKKARKRGGVLTSAKSARVFEDTDLLVLDENDLLGDDAVLLQGVKAIGDMNIDTLITYIAALFEGTTSPLRSLFLKMIDQKSVKLPKVHDLYYHGNGYTCLIESKMFLVGNAEFMRTFNVDFPEQLINLKLGKCKFPVYVAYHKSPVGVFITSYEPNKHTLDGLTYAENKSLSIGIASDDFNFSHKLLRELYPSVDSDHLVHLLSKSISYECTPYLQRVEKSSDMISSRNGFKGLIAAIIGAKKLLSALKINRVIRILYTIITLALIFFIALNGYSANTDLQILAFQSIWMLPVCAICIICK